MTQIKHNKLESFYKASQEAESCQFFLLYGESYLIKQGFEILSNLLLKDTQKKFAMETLEGGAVSMGDIIEHVSTFSFLVSSKIVFVKNAPLFDSGTRSNEIQFKPSDLDLLSDLIEKKLPENHFLIFTTSGIDKRRKIYKAIEKKGLVIDCSVPQGARKMDLDAQRTVLQKIAGQILEKGSKKIDTPAMNALIDRIGFNLDLFSQTLEKLITYSGNRTRIEVSDIQAVVKREKKDPIFNLTNAFLDKDTKHALFYLNSLINDGYHPLQILKSFENQVRKLLLVKSAVKILFVDKQIQFKRMNYNSFKQMVLPHIVSNDNRIKTTLDAQEASLLKEDSKINKTKPGDLLLAPNPQNAYPIFQVFQKSENFSLNELRHILFFLSDIDYQLKSSSFDIRTMIENFIMKACSKGGFVYAEEN